ncbi:MULTISPECIES: S9 family peptidase [unclassified Pseudoalteromonas]|uniref:S9 family peptidase n=1 Tax=unclassified Pseudoalteromonas TaxID=194690 RepID=UPI0011093749|nr:MULTISPECIES: S9 family peptidase [unclassified Pseudoalteromonas]TMN77604.1 oligopeptidase B [Pseudoalteromonas sp. S410]TMN90910.1 oligopeptidase B [Pseudoalteromonas sp. S408]TMN94889.1 oligopeptidase B [Pseudoalteromonas sp. S407]TMN95473.1 oligopeptidase B [Pseudoalteromonas sp. S409]TMO10551.1 oligopeptidase B [Pseudoalteromonas sp. S186]
MSSSDYSLSVLPHSPVAKKQPKTLITHDKKRNDDYYWMRDDERKNEKVLAHLQAENNYCDEQLASIKPLQNTLFEELKARIVKDDNSVPVKDGKYWYHSEVRGDDEYARHYRSTSIKAKNKALLLDVNELAQDFEFFDLGEVALSPNEQLMAYSQDTEGRRIYNVRFKNLSTGEMLADELENTEGQVVWANDNKTVFYVKKDLQTLLGYQVFRHELGSEQDQDVLVYEEHDSSFFMGLGKSRDESLIIIDLASTESNDTWVLDANNPQGNFSALMPREECHEFDVDKLGNTFYIVTNWQAKNFRLMTATEQTIADKTQWQEHTAHREHVLLEGVELFNDFLVLSEREQGQARFVVVNKEGERMALEFDDPCYYAAVAMNPEPNVITARIYYSSLTTPGSLYDVDLKTGKKTLLKQQKVLGDFNATDYQSERLMVTARDGVKVPVSVVYRKDSFNKDGTNPLFQYGYGAYGYTIDPSFSSTSLSLLDRGFVYVIAHVRGSEMLGRNWYEQGKKTHKQNSFSDFIDVTKALIAQNYCDSSKVFASGGSAGGLLMGAVLNQAPQLYCGVGCHVPFLDVLTTMLDESIPLTTNEYDEWGNPNDPQFYDVIEAYSPYDNISAQNYPNILVTTGLHDSQVQYWEPMKWVAKMREYKTDNNILVFKTDMDAGHGGASGRFKSLEEKALEMAFFIALVE